LVPGVSPGTASALAAASDSGDADDSVIVWTGRELYRNHCAVCRGPDAAGDGPFAQPLRTPPTNLTELAARNDGIFPYWQAYEKISGLQLLPARGSRVGKCQSGAKFSRQPTASSRLRQQALRAGKLPKGSPGWAPGSHRP